MARLAARGKRGAVDVANFLLDPHRHIYPLREELLSRSYQPSVPRGFLLHEPKPRLISALPFRDRVVQHLLIGACLPAFERWYAPQSYACRVGKGTHRALEAATRWFRSFPWVLRLDLAKFFPSIDHEVLRRQIDPRTPPEQRLADLGDRAILAMPDYLLKMLPDEAFTNLPSDVRDAIRKRIGR
jgi:retron-type reverse transcriptase